MVKKTHYKMQISKVNEVYLKIETDSGVERELADYFTFEVPGHRFMPAYRNKIWDGKIRLFSPATGKIYVGLLPYIKDFCYKNDIEYIIDKGVEDVRRISKATVSGYVRLLRPKTNGKKLKVRDYQIDAIRYAIESNRALLVSPTASGKSLIIYVLVRYYQQMNLKTLILVPTTSLVEQMYSDFEDYGWSSNMHCQKINQVNLDYAIVTGGPTLNVNIPNKIYIKSGTLGRPLDSAKRGVAPIIHTLNETNIDWVSLADDPRCLNTSLAKDLFNNPKVIFFLVSKAPETSTISAYLKVFNLSFRKFNSCRVCYLEIIA